MNQTTLPICQWRGAESREDGTYTCSSPKWSAHWGVTPEHCTTKCPSPNHEATEEQVRAKCRILYLLGSGECPPPPKLNAEGWLVYECINKLANGRIISFFQALWGHAQDWFRKVPEKEYRRRITICTTSGPAGGHCHKYRRWPVVEPANKWWRFLRLFFSYEELEHGCGGCGGCTGAKQKWASEKCPLTPPRWDVYKAGPPVWQVWWHKLVDYFRKPPTPPPEIVPPCPGDDYTDLTEATKTAGG